MKPYLFNLGDYPVSSFYFMIIVGVLICVFYIEWVGGRQGLQRKVFYDLGMVGLISGVLGARIFHILVEAPGYYWEHPLRVFDFWRGGFVSFGAYIMATASVFLYIKLRRLDFWRYIDVVAIGVPIIQFFIRIACLLTGCCYGKPTDLPWGIRFTDPAATAYHFYPDLPLHPVQIYSALHALVLFIAINLFYFKKQDRFPGQSTWLMFIAYLIPRAIIEFWRADSDRGIWFGGVVSTGQLVGLFGSFFAVFMYLHLKKHHERAKRS